jgi:molybdopterin-containing oxidoreductase family membrane subunit
MTLVHFFRDGIREAFRGPPVYWAWVGFLGLVFLAGLWFYVGQLQHGLVVTNMTNQVSWGFYIANFAFLVGVAAAAVMLVVPAYIFHREDVKDVVLLGDTLAISAVVMAMLFIVVDLGRPDRVWHLIPFIGQFNFPASMLAWDGVVLNGYLLLNVGISFYIVYNHYKGRQPRLRNYFPFVLIAIFWAISIHTVTAFLFTANHGRPFWDTPLLAPRFIASAFASGPAISILVLQVIRKVSDYPVRQSAIDTLALVMAVALQVTLFFVLAELFREFYNESHHARQARYLFLGLEGYDALRPWIWSGLAMLVVAVTILMIHPLRRNPWLLNVAAVLTIVGVWIEKGMGLVVPGFVPTPTGEIWEYMPSLAEVVISAGIWAAGLLVFTFLAKAAIPIECGRLRAPGVDAANDACAPRPQPASEPAPAAASKPATAG